MAGLKGTFIDWRKPFYCWTMTWKNKNEVFYHLVDNPKNKWFFWGPFYLKVLIWFFVGWRQLIVCYTLLKGWNLEKIDSRITCETALKTNLSVQKTNLKRCFSSQKCTFIWIMVNMQLLLGSFSTCSCFTTSQGHRHNLQLHFLW
jgi:hypothetical protein